MLIEPNKQSYIHNLPKYLGMAILMIVVNIAYVYIINLSTIETVDIIGNMDMSFILLILPVSLLIEEVITRGLIYRLTKGTLTNKVAFFCVLYILAVVHMLLHYGNLIDPSLINMLKYFSVQFVSGLFLGYVILKYGFKASYTVHVLYDFIIIFTSIILSDYFHII
jgi:membrane protease YdiL (CAAX protease family)